MNQQNFADISTMASATRGLRRVFIRDLVLPARVGIHDHEREQDQPVIINVDASVEEASEGTAGEADAGSTSTIADVVCYETLTEQIKEVLTGGHIDLVEVLAENIATRLLADPRIIWNTQSVVAAKGGTAVQSKTGHAFIKQIMREVDAVYGGEMSAHHYFRDFAYCDSGMIPWLLVIELMSRTGKPLSELVAERIAACPSSGEVNFRLEDPKASIAKVIAAFEGTAEGRDETDGISLSFADWRFNLRSSNAELVVRLNIEAKADRDLVRSKLEEITNLLQD